MTDTLTWLSDSDPAIRWQVMRDLLGSPTGAYEAERARVEVEGWGARLLSHQDADGQWAGGAYNPADFDWSGPEGQPGAGQPWTATTHSLSQLRTFGLDPSSDSARRTAELLTVNARWDEGDQPYWEGEVEPCINGITVANGSYFGVDTSSIVDRLLDSQLSDGGWNCDADSSKTSFDTTINVLEGLLEFEKAHTADAGTKEVRRAAEEYFLDRSLFRRLNTGEPADDDYLLLRNPARWQYDILRGLDYFRDARSFEGSAPDERLAEALSIVRSKQAPDGRWALDKVPPGRVWFHVDDGPGHASKWITLRAMRVLAWADTL